MVKIVSQPCLHVLVVTVSTEMSEGSGDTHAASCVDKRGYSGCRWPDWSCMAKADEWRDVWPDVGHFSVALCFGVEEQTSDRPASAFSLVEPTRLRESGQML